MPEFRCELKKYRQLKNLTQEQLGQMVGGAPGNHHAPGSWKI